MIVENKQTRITDEIYKSNLVRIRRLYPSITDDQLASVLHYTLMEAERKFDPSKKVKFGAYVWFLMKRRIIDEIRRTGPIDRHGNKRVQFLQSDEIGKSDIVVERSICYDDDPLDKLIKKERIERLKKFFTGKKYIIIKSILKGMNCGEIADELGIKKDSVYFHYKGIREDCHYYAL